MSGDDAEPAERSDTTWLIGVRALRIRAVLARRRITDRDRPFGYTLGELLLVVGMVTSLAAVVMPTVGRFTVMEEQRNLLLTEHARVQAAIDAYAGDTRLPLNASIRWTSDLFSGSADSNGVNLTGLLPLPGGASTTIDHYCWGRDGIVRQLSTNGGTYP